MKYAFAMASFSLLTATGLVQMLNPDPVLRPDGWRRDPDRRGADAGPRYGAGIASSTSRAQ